MKPIKLFCASWVWLVIAPCEVTRRSQLSLKDESVEKTEQDSGDDAAAKPKAKAKPRAKSESKAKAKGKAKAKAKSNHSADGLKEPETLADGPPKPSGASADIAGEDGEVKGMEVDESGDRPPQPTGSMDGSSALHKLKSSMNLGGSEVGKDGTPEAVPSAAPKAPRKRKVVAGDQEEGHGAAAKRVKGEVASFARRPQPTGPLSKLKWSALRSAFNQKIKPGLKHYSAEEA